jgi:general stress protein 26
MDTRRRVYELLQNVETAMMVTHTRSGPLDCRPMHVAEVEHDGPLWFVTSSESRKALEIQQDADTLLAFQDGNGHYLALWGGARLVDESQRVERLWKDAYRVWFPEGLADPNLRLVSLTPHTAEFWDIAGGNSFCYVFESGSAFVRAKPNQ